MGLFDTFVAWDTETTGFLPNGRIIEFGLVVFENGEAVHEWSHLFCPENVDWQDSRVKEALAVNHITREMLEGQPTFNQVVPDLLLELEHDVWVAHNAEFDLGMLKSEFARCGREAPAPVLSVCTKLLGAYFANAPGNKLAQVAERYGVKQAEAHRAVGDAWTCGSIFQEMVRSGKLPDTLSLMHEFMQKADKAWSTRNRR
jgi:DNA polymerase III epsilon subunit family exonuclease